MVEQTWISTSKANRLLDLGICDDTFREKFRPYLPWKLTPGGQFRWLRAAVLELKQAMPEAG